MSRSLLRSVLELRTPITRLPPTFLLPIHARRFNSTAPIIEPAAHDAPPVAPSDAATKPSIAQQAQAAAAKTATPSSTTPIAESVQAVLPFLAAQPNHYITFHIHGRPYLVQPGDSVRLPFKMPGVVPGDVLRLNRASVIGSRDYTLKGAPFIDERVFECRAVVTGTESEPMRLKTKTKRRQRRVKTVKSKHRFTTLTISELKINGPEEIEA
ncbi:homocitrate dehydratase, mitochondrial [Colletotrichum spaethianum]|uniref:Large ribosomal subunit protein bL21m n=1 Tax=Colletotrichum spaethianum TaxID=700344 RepID=A0AA37L660_9PEZI|nr:homocitrate dehydratase, mitochondrial [Colletotrichum spaethianum]GKT40150.1 homocitrate dehydratase, mitochondrial [Colletotrichum spaethianum]